MNSSTKEQALFWTEHNYSKKMILSLSTKFLLEIPPVNECDFSWITEINELIEVILEKSHKFTVGFPFNTRVKTLNH